MEAGPGVSLFQGSESIHLNTDAQRLVEDEDQEDKKRCDAELKQLLTNAFDDLGSDDDDASSLDSSHNQDDNTTNCTNTVVSSGLELSTPVTDQVAEAQVQEYDVYNCVDNVNNHDNDVMTNHMLNTETSGNAQTDFDMYRQMGTPYINNRFNDSNSTMSETPYKLRKPPTVYSRKIQPAEECTVGENYPYNYETPSNHYNTRMPGKYSNNGFIDAYENVQNKQVQEFGGGDNATSDHMNHCYKTSPNGRPVDDAVAYKASDYNSKDQLEVLYMVRMKEISRLTEELQQLQLEKEDEKNQMSRKFMLLQAEVDKTNISRNQAQHALVDAKAEIADLQMQMDSLKEENAILEKTNQNLKEELNIARGSVMDLQQKIAVLERTQILQMNDRTHEKFLKQAQEKHTVEITNMQTQIDVLTDKLNSKETSYVTLEHKLDDARRAHEALMVEKGDTMNRLAQALEESQAQCRNLMSTNSAQQVIQLQTQVKMLTQEKDELHKNVQKLQNKLELTKNDVAQYDLLLATTLEDESDSIRQMKLGEFHNKSRSKPVDDITNKLRGELQRCLAGQTVKRKEINRLENTLSQKEKELDNALITSETCRQEAARYAKRVNELEQELKSVLTDEAMKANAKIQKLSDHLNDVKEQYELLRAEKINVEQKLEEALAVNQEKLEKMHQETMEQQEKEAVDEYNKEYLEIHAKAVERVKQEAQKEIVQLSVQLEETQKELNHVKELYIEVYGTKEQLINDHKNEIKILKKKYATIELQQKDIEKLENELQTQIRLCSRLTKESEDYKSKIIDLEKDLVYERRKKEDHVKKIHSEIERAKEEALHELRNAYPNQEISFLLPDHCSEHLEKINQLEEDCKRLEEKLQIAVQEQKKLSDDQNKLDDAKLKIAQMEISQESWKKKYEKVVNERKDLSLKVSKLDLELLNLKRSTKLEDSDNLKLTITRFQTENETLKSQCNNLLGERNTCKKKISELETGLYDAKKKISNLEGKLRKNSESLNPKNELEKDKGSRYKDLVTQLSRLNNSKDERTNESLTALEQRIQELEHDLQGKDEEFSMLRKDFEKIKHERDQVVFKMRNQAKQFEQYVKSQNKVSAELNLSPRSMSDNTDFQKMREIMAKEVREEMEPRVAKELKEIEEQNKKELEEKYKSVILEWQAKCNEKDQKAETLQKEIMTERFQINQITQFIGSKLQICNQELQTHKLQIEKLEMDLKKKENQVEEDRNCMTRMMIEWAAELKESKAKEMEKNEEIQKVKSNEEKLSDEIKTLKDKEKNMKSDMDMLKRKYQSAKQTAHNYKNYAEKKGEFLSNECKRIEEGYKKAINEVQQNFLAHDEQYAAKVKDVENRYKEKYERLRLTTKYKDNIGLL